MGSRRPAVITAPAPVPAPMAAPVPRARLSTEEKTSLVVSLMGKLLIARKDVKAIEHGKHGWMPDRERAPRGTKAADMPCIPMRMSDFQDHLFGKRCMGTYLLDANDCVKFFAIDIDLKTENAIMFTTPDMDSLDKSFNTWRADVDKIVGELDLESIYVGNIEEALHDPEHVGHRWARALLRDMCERVVVAIREQLGLHPLVVITGGGAHVLVPMGEPTPAPVTRAAANTVMEACGLELFKGDCFWRQPDNEQCGIEIEVFPKQDSLGKSAGFGNLIRLPLGWHEQAGMRTYFLDLEARSKLVEVFNESTQQQELVLVGMPWWELPRAEPISTLEAAARAVGIEVKI